MQHQQKETFFKCTLIRIVYGSMLVHVTGVVQ
jgi:hypothetical protein